MRRVLSRRTPSNRGQAMLTARDYKNLLDIIDLAYSIPDRAEMFRTVCERLQKLVYISSAAFIPANRATKAFQVQDSAVFNAPTKPMSLFVSHYAPLQPYIAKTAQAPAKHLNKVVRLTEIVSASRLPDTEYGCDFQPLTPIFYELDLWPGCQGDLVGGMGLHRQKRDHDFTDRDKQIVSLLVPHLARAFHLQTLFQETPSADTGIIMVGSDGQPLYMNDEAARALNGRPVSTIPDPGICTGSMLFWTGTGTYHVVTRQHPRSRRGKMIFLEPLPRTQVVQSKLSEFGLTQRQQEIALLAVRGLSNREISERLFIAEQTVKDHLHDVFEQIRVRSRSELSAKVLGLLICRAQSDEAHDA